MYIYYMQLICDKLFLHRDNVNKCGSESYGMDIGMRRLLNNKGLYRENLFKTCYYNRNISVVMIRNVASTRASTTL